jgi:hypothetical protein
VAVLLYDCESADKAAQSLLEMVRGGIGDQAVDVTAFVDVGTAGLDRQFVATLPFDVRDWDSATGPRALSTAASNTLPCSSRPGCTTARTCRG